ncbi:MAG: tRNA pseudouridine(38-40) synthase TruA [Alphaproteobacteria bacterium]|nr:tRNA pseudouridine(38-40) synthase TruA [Alphaproteobacteria bacterium]
MSQRYKIIVEYDGTNLLGWQKQLDGASAQEYLERAVFGFCAQKVEVCGSGRTDAGVHALGQVAHFDLDFVTDTFRIREALNAHLRSMNAPVAVLSVETVDNDFNSRFSAQKRRYIYRITNRKAPLIIDRFRSWWVYVPLNVEKMRQGAQLLLGYHDFTSFRAAKCQAKSPLKTLDKLDISIAGEEILFTVEAKSFLHHQVRNMVGTLKMVGDGHLSPQDISTILESKNRSSAGPTAPAHGLYLDKIFY